MAYQHACLLGKVFSGSGEQLPDLPEVFPFWDEDEVCRMRASRIQQKMMQIASKPVRKDVSAHGGGTTEKTH